MVDAAATQEQFSVAANIAASDNTAVGGAISVLVSDNHTNASIGDAATLDADGNVVVEASQDSEMLAIAGNAGVSTSESAYGLSAAVYVHVDQVKAYVGKNAEVTARGKWGETEGVRGLGVTATSSEEVLSIAAALSAARCGRFPRG